MKSNTKNRSRIEHPCRKTQRFRLIYFRAKRVAYPLFRAFYFDFEQLVFELYFKGLDPYKDRSEIDRFFRNNCKGYGYAQNNKTRNWTAYPQIPSFQWVISGKEIAKENDRVCTVGGCKNKVAYNRLGGICRTHNKNLLKKGIKIPLEGKRKYYQKINIIHVISYLRKGYPINWIAKKLKVTSSGIRTKLSRIGLTQQNILKGEFKNAEL